MYHKLSNAENDALYAKRHNQSEAEAMTTTNAQFKVKFNRHSFMAKRVDGKLFYQCPAVDNPATWHDAKRFASKALLKAIDSAENPKPQNPPIIVELSEKVTGQVRVDGDYVIAKFLREMAARLGLYLQYAFRTRHGTAIWSVYDTQLELRIGEMPSNELQAFLNGFDCAQRLRNRKA